MHPVLEIMFWLSINVALGHSPPAAFPSHFGPTHPRSVWFGWFFGPDCKMHLFHRGALCLWPDGILWAAMLAKCAFSTELIHHHIASISPHALVFFFSVRTNANIMFFHLYALLQHWSSFFVPTITTHIKKEIFITAVSNILSWRYWYVSVKLMDKSILLNVVCDVTLPAEGSTGSTSKAFSKRFRTVFFFVWNDIVSYSFNAL